MSSEDQPSNGRHQKLMLVISAWTLAATVAAIWLGYLRFASDATNQDVLGQLQSIEAVLSDGLSESVPQEQVEAAARASAAISRKLVGYAIDTGQLETGEVYLLAEGGVVLKEGTAREFITPSGKLTSFSINSIREGYILGYVDGDYTSTLYLGGTVWSDTDEDCRYIVTGIDLENRTATIRLDCSSKDELRISP